ncbi:MAG: tRNA dihydrouridine synthase, partial [Gemmatirosa sp.]
FGCPVKKVVKRNGGSGCLKDLDLVQTIIRAVVRATHLPVTVKTRSGWSEDTRDPVGIALRMQDAGAKAFTLHARTRTQMYTGHARWEEIAAVVEALEVPVIGNGDIKTPEDALRMHRVTNAAGIMIGRGSYGQPWIFDQTKDLLAGRPMRATPDVETRFAVALDHARMVQEYEADPIGAAIEFRKHLGWYAKGLPNSADLRRKLHTVSSFGEVEGIFADYVERMRRGEFAQPSTGAATADGGEALGVEEPCCEDAVA